MVSNAGPDYYVVAVTVAAYSYWAFHMLSCMDILMGIAIPWISILIGYFFVGEYIFLKIPINTVIASISAVYAVYAALFAAISADRDYSGCMYTALGVFPRCSLIWCVSPLSYYILPSSQFVSLIEAPHVALAFKYFAVSKSHNPWFSKLVSYKPRASSLTQPCFIIAHSRIHSFLCISESKYNRNAGI